MTLRKWSPWLMLALVLVLAACGGNGDGDGGDVNLSQSVTDEDADFGSISVDYPEGWVARAESGSILFANSQETLDRMDEPQAAPQADDAFGSVFVFPSELASVFGITEDASMTDVMGIVVTDVLVEGEDTQFDLGDPQEFSANGDDAVLVSGTVTEGDQTNSGVIVLVDEGGGYALLVIVAAEDEAGEYDDIARAMAGSIEYTPPEAEG